MKIEDFLKQNLGRLSSGEAWLVWDNSDWIVYCRPYGKKINRVLYHGTSLDKAVDALVKGNE